MRYDLRKAVFPAALIVVSASVLAFSHMALIPYIESPIRDLSRDIDWGYLNRGLDRIHSFRDTTRWWTGTWCGEVPFWRPLTSYVFWGERLLWPKDLMLPRQIISVLFHLIFIGLGGWLTWILTRRRWLILVTVWLFAGARPYPMNALFGYLRPVGDVLSDPKNIPDPLAGIPIMISLILLAKGRWIAALAAAVISVGFKELGFTAWLLALVVPAWMNRTRITKPGYVAHSIKKNRLPIMAWLLAFGLMGLVHYLAVGYGYNCGSNRAWFWRAAAYFGGPAGAELVTRNVLPVFVAVLLFASTMGLRRMSILVKLAGALGSFGLGVLLDSHLQGVSLDISMVRVLDYGLELKTILICVFWLLVAWEARHDWQTVALGSALCFFAAFPSWMVAQALEHTLYIATFFMEIAVAAAICTAISPGERSNAKP